MIGSKLKEISFAELLENNPVLFARFHIRVSEFMSDLLPTSGIPLPGGQRIAYSAINMVSFQIHTFQRNLSNGSTDCSLSISEDQLRVSWNLASSYGPFAMQSLFSGCIQIWLPYFQCKIRPSLCTIALPVCMCCWRHKISYCSSTGLPSCITSKVFCRQRPWTSPHSQRAPNRAHISPIGHSGSSSD